ncbi:hypothetical protein, partial [Providencia stuartii]|uniref:hypothetical protein n=1 Tax=Providencia stuartii TaxID=588 RepID=UPI0013D7A105
INDRIGSRALLAGGPLAQQVLCRGILLGGLLPAPPHRLRGIPGPLFASLTQRGDLPDLLRHCVLQAAPGGAAGDQIRQRSIE